MTFRSQNYIFGDIQHQPFITIAESSNPISCITVHNGQPIYASRKSVKKLPDYKIQKFANEISALSASDEFIVGGDVRGTLKVISNNGRILRQYNDHEMAINQFRFLDARHIVTCSDDMTAKIYDIAKSEPIHIFADHNDCVKGIEITQNLIFTISLDSKLNIYDSRNFELVHTYDNHKSLYNIQHHRENEIILTTRHEIKIFDIRKNSDMIETKACTKQITRVNVHDGMIYSSSLDCTFNCYNSKLELVDSVNLGNGILDFAISDNLPYLGMADGKIKSIIKPNKMEKSPIKYRNKVMENVEVKHEDKPYVRYDEVEKMLKGFNYRKCLQFVIERNNIQEIYSVLRYLEERRGLKQALQDWDDKKLGMLLDFISENFFNTKFRTVFIEMMILITAIYEGKLLDKYNLREFLACVGDSVDELIILQEECIKLLAFVECIGVNNISQK
ncbi:U3 small nucleolar RNA-associated protein 15 like protein [Astathelohania contejeani]|uniref:U3 small nucleolar RNA-associated protein 15 like protein n=1 Tax=Astathelohania contejeani TaxID=164912 RepID=A0ABQ7HYW0_9MICR|nr:U3 small nucleolar RNA-associated protein 15 like protein [Thelohania contejeani]